MTLMKESDPKEPDDIVLKRVEHEYDLAQRGLYGTLLTAIVGLVLMGLLVALAMLLPILSEKQTIALTGNQLVIIILGMLAILAICAFLYGAFVFKRLARVDADLKTRTGSVEVGASTKE